MLRLGQKGILIPVVILSSLFIIHIASLLDLKTELIASPESPGLNPFDEILFDPLTKQRL